MKILKLILVFLVFLTACNKEDNVNNIDVESDIKNAELEKKVLDVNRVLKATKIQNSSSLLIVNEMPETSDDIKITLPKEELSAFQNVNLNFNIKSSQDFDGVYIRSKDKGGNLSAEILRVEFSGILDIWNEPIKDKLISLSLEGIEPGEFCYAISVFKIVNSENNEELVSKPEDICVEIEAWGGNSEISGDWNYLKDKLEIPTTTDKDKSSGEWRFNNVEYTATDFSCGSSRENREVKILTNINSFKLNKDGTFFMNIKSSRETYLESDFVIPSETGVFNSNQCLEKPRKIITDIEYYGNWAYDEESDELTIINFKIKDKTNPEKEEIIPGGRIWLYKGSLSLDNNTLNIIDNKRNEARDRPSSVFFSPITRVLSR